MRKPHFGQRRPWLGPLTPQRRPNLDLKMSFVVVSGLCSDTGRCTSACQPAKARFRFEIAGRRRFLRGMRNTPLPVLHRCVTNWRLGRLFISRAPCDRVDATRRPPERFPLPLSVVRFCGELQRQPRCDEWSNERVAFFESCGPGFTFALSAVAGLGHTCK